MGRPAAFDRDQVVDQVTDLFWKKGYLGTSIADVVSATSLKPGSIYNSFDSKQSLLLEALDRYSSDTIRGLRRSIKQHDRLLPALEQMMDDLVDLAAQDSEGKGCLMLNIWLEMAAHDPVITGYVEGVFARFEAEIFEAMTHALQRGEMVARSDPRMLAKYLMMATWGIRVVSRSKPDRATLEALSRQAMMPIRTAFV